MLVASVFPDNFIVHRFTLVIESFPLLLIFPQDEDEADAIVEVSPDREREVRVSVSIGILAPRLRTCSALLGINVVVAARVKLMPITCETSHPPAPKVPFSHPPHDDRVRDDLPTLHHLARRKVLET